MVNVVRKGGAIRHVSIKETNVSEPPITRRELINEVKTKVVCELLEQAMG